jgi:hypothetical protein
VTFDLVLQDVKDGFHLRSGFLESQSEMKIFIQNVSRECPGDQGSDGGEARQRS